MPSEATPRTVALETCAREPPGKVAPGRAKTTASPASSCAAALVTTRRGLPVALSPPAVPASRHKTDNLSASGWRSMERTFAATRKGEEEDWFRVWRSVGVGRG